MAASSVSTPSASNHAFESLPRRIFLDSCTAQTLRDYGGYIYEGELIAGTDRIRNVTDGTENLDALREIFVVTERAHFEWIVSRNSMVEASDKRDSGHMQWLWDIAAHSAGCVAGDGQTTESALIAARLSESTFGYLSKKDRRLIRDAIILRCEAFLTVERRLPRNANHLQRELGIQILTPILYWKMLRPWAALWR